MMQPAKHRPSTNGSSNRAIPAGRLGEAGRPSLADALIRPAIVVEGPVLVQDQLG